MPGLQIVSVCEIRPARIDEWNDERIELTPWDLSLLHAEYTQRGLLFQQPGPSENTISDLRSALPLVLNKYFPIAGRLVKSEIGCETVAFHLSCNSSGARFVHSVSDRLTVDDLLNWGSVSTSLYRSLFPMNGIKNIQGVSEPLLAIQVTQLLDGLFIAFGFNHIVADGSSFWHFVDDWSQLSACFDKSVELNLDPLIPKRWFLQGTEPPIPIPYSVCVSDFSPFLQLEERVFRFTKGAVAELKTISTRTAVLDVKISSFQALVAHLWQSITRHRRLDDNQQLHCRILVDMRHRLRPPMDKRCFGNLVQFGSTTATVKELLGHGLGWAAAKINQMVASQTDGEARKFADDWAKKPTIPNLIQGNSSLIVAGSTRFGVYGCNFGSGPALAVRAGPGNQSDGKVVVFPGKEEGSVDVQLCLSPDTLKGLAEDVEFLATIG